MYETGKLKILKDMRDEYKKKADTLDEIIYLIETTTDDYINNKNIKGKDVARSLASFVGVEKSTVKGKTGNTRFISTLDITKIPDYNGGGSGVLVD